MSAPDMSVRAQRAHYISADWPSKFDGCGYFVADKP